MWSGEVRPRLLSCLAERGVAVPVARNHFFMGLGESELASRIEPALGNATAEFELGYCLKASGIFVRCIGAPEVVDALADTIRSAAPEDYVGEGEVSIQEAVVGALSQRGERVATAESCTGGLISCQITDVPGSSDVFEYGFVTYANEAKRDVLEVDQRLLDEHGAVSEPVVRAMADGARKVAGADHALAVSGIAGPGGGTEDKPVGTVWIGLSSKGADTIARRHLFKTDRLHFKQRTAATALDLLRRRLAGTL